MGTILCNNKKFFTGLPIITGFSAALLIHSPVATAEGDGKTVYDGLCAACHGSGIPGIPQVGDAAAWETRIAKGNDMLYDHALNGFTGDSGMTMPPKGGDTSLTVDEIKAAVDYMVSNSR